MARAQFAQYGMNNVPDEYVNNYVEEMMKKHENIDSFIEAALDRKLSVALKSIVKLKKKSVSLDEFNKLMMPAEEAAAEKPAKAKRTKKADKAEKEEK